MGKLDVRGSISEYRISALLPVVKFQHPAFDQAARGALARRVSTADNMTLFALLFGILMGSGSLAWGYAQAGLLQFARWMLIFGALWLIAVWRRWRWFAHIGVAFNFLAAALGLWFLNFSPGWMFAGVIGGLLAWDLTGFRYRLRFSASDEERRLVETRHLRRITFLALLGLLLASLAMILKLQFNLEWALLLALVAAFGILQVVAWFRTARRTLRKRN